MKRGQKDYSTKMSPGRLRSKAGSDATAGNAVKTSSKGVSGNKVGSVKNRHRFQKTRTRSDKGSMF